MNKDELEYIVNKECSECGNGKKIVIENPRGFDVHEKLCKSCFVRKYPQYKDKV